MNGLGQDLVTMIRSHARSWKLSLAALICTALGIGAAIFIAAIGDAVLTRRLPFPDAGRLVRVWCTDLTSGLRLDLSYPEYLDLAESARSFDALEIVARTRVTAATVRGTERLRGEAVTPGYFRLIGASPARGRLFSEKDYTPEADRTVVISHSLWMEGFGGRADIVGSDFSIRGFSDGRATTEARTIIGVMPVGFSGTVDDDVSEFWIPVAHYTPRRLLDNRHSRMVWVMARLAPEATAAGAALELEALTARARSDQGAAWESLAFTLEPVGEKWRERYRAGLVALGSAVALLLLVACTNVANLLLARLAARERELAIRTSLGASRGRIFRHLLLEAFSLAAIGGGAGTVAALAALRIFTRREILRLPSYIRIEPDLRLLVAAIVLVLLTGLVFGLIPGIVAFRTDLARHVHDSRRSGGLRPGQARFGRLLVGAQAAFTVLLLIGAVLIAGSHFRLRSADLGYRSTDLLRMAITLDATDYPEPSDRLRFSREARSLFESHPGVESVSFMGSVLPPWFDHEIRVHALPRPEAAVRAEGHYVDSHFFRTLDIGILRGRAIGEADREDSIRVAVISAALARAIAGGDGLDAIGKEIATAPEGATEIAVARVVGIAENVRYQGPRSERPPHDVYIPLAQQPQMILSIAILTSVDPGSLIDPLQRKLGRFAPTSPIHWVSTMEEELALQNTDTRLYAVVTVAFSATALILALLGIYGVAANWISRRSAEIGVRIALGAPPGNIERLVIAQGTRPVVLGIAAGCLVAAWATRLLQSLLYEMHPAEPAAFAIAAGAVLAATLLACLVAARQALRHDPTRLLRQ